MWNGEASPTKEAKPVLGNARITAIVPVSDLGAAIEFYEGTLGLKQVELLDIEEFPEARFEAAGGALSAYQSGYAGQSGHTLAGFSVDDLDAVMADLRSRGVTFEEYDLPGLKTENGVATFGDLRAAWFKDPDGNILAVDGRLT
jgi:predicted enzyme related to lactoylglutathione lyase